MQNLREKLLKAGLVSEEQTRAADQSARQPKARPLEVPKLPPLPGSKAHHRLEALKQRERDQQLRELVLTTEVPVELGSHAFHFVTRKGRLRRLELTEAQAKALEEGQLAVVERQEPAQIEHSLVPPETAERMLALFPKAVRFFSKPGEAVGFLTEEELRAHQASEAAAGPEESTAQAPLPPEEPEERASGVFIAVKRSPKP